MDEKQVEKLLNEIAKIPVTGGLSPRESIRTAAIAKLSKPSLWKRIINYKVPVYQLAAAVLVAFIGFAAISFFKPQEKESVVIQKTQPEETAAVRNRQPADYGFVKSSSVRIGINVRQDRLKTLCDSLLL